MARPDPSGLGRLLPPAVKTVVVVQDGRSASAPLAGALAGCFARRGWRVKSVTTERIATMPDLVAGWGFRAVMRDACAKWPDRFLHLDAGFWSRHAYYKLAFGGGRWTPLTGQKYGSQRLHVHGVIVQPARDTGQTILVCGMSQKASETWGLEPEAWERAAVRRLRAVGAKVIYRPKPTWPGAKPIRGAKRFDRSASIDQTLRLVHGVVSHHSNAAVDALAAGLPIYVETGSAKSLSVSELEDVVGATAPDQEARERFLREIAWHQWTIAEIAEGAWLNPPAPLAGHPTLS